MMTIVVMMMLTASIRDALVAIGEGEGKTCKLLQRVLFEDGQVDNDNITINP